MNGQVKRPRGRPRPSETVERDERVMAYLREHGPQTRNDLAMALLLSKTHTYAALNRLRDKGLVRICASRGGPNVLWTHEVSAPCP